MESRSRSRSPIHPEHKEQETQSRSHSPIHPEHQEQETRSRSRSPIHPEYQEQETRSRSRSPIRTEFQKQDSEKEMPGNSYENEQPAKEQISYNTTEESGFIKTRPKKFMIAITNMPHTHHSEAKKFILENVKFSDTTKRNIGYVDLRGNSLVGTTCMASFFSEDAAKEACEQLNGLQVDGKLLQTSMRPPKPDFKEIKMEEEPNIVKTHYNKYKKVARPLKNATETYGLSPHLLASLNITLPLYPKILVYNFPSNIAEEKVREIFSLAGQILDVYIKRIPDQCTVFIDYDHPVEAVQAISMFHKKEFNNKMLIVHMNKSEKGYKMKLPIGMGKIGPGLGENGGPIYNVRLYVELQMIKQRLLELSNKNARQTKSMLNTKNTSTWATETPNMRDSLIATNAMMNNSSNVNNLNNTQMLQTLLQTLIQQGTNSIFGAPNSQNSTLNVPNIMPNAPNAMPNVPNTMTSVPNAMTNVPNDMTYVPNAMANVPNAMTNVPNAMTNVPNAMTNVPNAMTNVPNTMTSVPNALTNVPNAVTNVPNAMTNVPNAMTNVPNAMTNVPNAMTYVPNAMTNVPNAMTNVPNAMTYNPNVMTNVPNAVTNAPNHMTNAPNHMTNVPSDMANVPNHISKVPYYMTNVQNYMTNVPNQMRNTPNVVSNAATVTSNVAVNKNITVLTPPNPPRYSGPTVDNKRYEQNSSSNRSDNRNRDTGGSSKESSSGFGDNSSKRSNMVVFKYLPPYLTLDALKTKMREIGEIKFAELTGHGKAVMRFAKSRDAEKCIHLFDKSKVDGQVIKVQYF